MDLFNEIKLACKVDRMTIHYWQKLVQTPPIPNSFFIHLGNTTLLKVNLYIETDRAGLISFISALFEQNNLNPFNCRR